MAVALDGTDGAEKAEGRNMAGEPRDTLTFSGFRLAADAAAPVRGGTTRAALYRRGALARATMMSGALERAMDLAVDLRTGASAVRPADFEVPGGAAESRGAGRPDRRCGGCGKFRHRVAVAQRPRSPRNSAWRSPRRGSAMQRPWPVRSPIRCMARSALPRNTRCNLQHADLWSWREEFGSDVEWAARLGASVCALGADELWPTLTAQ